MLSPEESIAQGKDMYISYLADQAVKSYATPTAAQVAETQINQLKATLLAQHEIISNLRDRVERLEAFMMRVENG